MSRWSYLILMMGASSCVTADPAAPVREACVNAPCPQATDTSYVRTHLQSGTEVFWPLDDRNCIEIYESLEWPPSMGWDKARPSLKRAVETWESAARDCDASVCLRYMGPAPDDQEWGYSSSRNVNLLAFVQDNDVWLMVPDVENNPEALAVTVTSALSTGAYADADIVFNEALYDFTRRPNSEAGTDIESVMLHEMGHVLGFAHTSAGVDSVMGETLASGGIQRVLTTVDRAGLCETFGY